MGGHHQTNGSPPETPHDTEVSGQQADGTPADDVAGPGATVARSPCRPVEAAPVECRPTSARCRIEVPDRRELEAMIGSGPFGSTCRSRPPIPLSPRRRDHGPPSRSHEQDTSTKGHAGVSPLRQSGPFFVSRSGSSALPDARDLRFPGLPHVERRSPLQWSEGL